MEHFALAGATSRWTDSILEVPELDPKPHSISVDFPLVGGEGGTPTAGEAGVSDRISLMIKRTMTGGKGEGRDKLGDAD